MKSDADEVQRGKGRSRKVHEKYMSRKDSLTRVGSSSRGGAESCRCISKTSEAAGRLEGCVHGWGGGGGGGGVGGVGGGVGGGGGLGVGGGGGGVGVCKKKDFSQVLVRPSCSRGTPHEPEKFLPGGGTIFKWGMG